MVEAAPERLSSPAVSEGSAGGTVSVDGGRGGSLAWSASAGLEAVAEASPRLVWGGDFLGSPACFAPAGLGTGAGAFPGFAWELGVAGPLACFVTAGLEAEAVAGLWA